MKATIVLIADNKAANYGGKLMLKAHRLGNLGFEANRLPLHVSLKQPFSIASLDEMENFFDELAKELHPVTITLGDLHVYPSNVLGGTPSGCLSMQVNDPDELKKMQQLLFQKLEARFGPCPAEHDEDYFFHMTIAIGNAPFENYLCTLEPLSKEICPQTFCFSRLGLLYYDDDAIHPGTYYCYKVLDLTE